MSKHKAAPSAWPKAPGFGMTVAGFVLMGLMMTGAAVAPGQSRIVNARLETHAATGGLEAEMRTFLAAQGEPGWMGYAFPAIDNGHESCCWENVSALSRNLCGRCALESEHGSKIQGAFTDTSGNGTEHLEGSAGMIALLRAADHRIGEVRTFSENCEVDAGGLRVVWLTGVTAAESVAVLRRIVDGGNLDEHEERRAAEGALAAIAMTADPSADRAMESFVAASRPEKLRSQAAFWLGSERGAAGLKVLEGMAKGDPSDHVREQVAFAYSVSQEPRAADDLIRMAKEDGSGHVRGQAMFWLAQKAGRRAAETIASAIENDPDTATKKSAVFALYNMPREEGVPLLIQVAKTNKNRDVRKQAFFWLGQTNDPRALEFFEEVLGR